MSLGAVNLFSLRLLASSNPLKTRVGSFATLYDYAEGGYSVKILGRNFKDGSDIEEAPTINWSKCFSSHGCRLLDWWGAIF